LVFKAWEFIGLTERMLFILVGWLYSKFSAPGLSNISTNYIYIFCQDRKD